MKDLLLFFVTCDSKWGVSGCGIVLVGKTKQFEDVTLTSGKFDVSFFFPSFFYRLTDWWINHEVIGRYIDDERNKIWLQQFSTKNNPTQTLKHPVRTNYNNFCAPEPQVLVLVRMTHRSSAKKLNKSHVYEINSVHSIQWPASCGYKVSKLSGFSEKQWGVCDKTKGRRTWNNHKILVYKSYSINLCALLSIILPWISIKTEKSHEAG